MTTKFSIIELIPGFLDMPIRELVDRIGSMQDWAIEIFGPLGWADANYELLNDSRWGRSVAGHFVFRDDADAVLFKLRWVG